MQIDGQQVFRCADCRDTSMVTVVSKRAIWCSLRIIEFEKEKAFPVTYQSVYCHCEAGDFELDKYLKWAKATDWRHNQYQCFGESRYHIHSREILDWLECFKCSEAKTVTDWDVVELEITENEKKIKKDHLKCKFCGHLWVKSEVKPDWQLVLEKVRHIDCGYSGDDVLSQYTSGLKK